MEKPKLRRERLIALGAVREFIGQPTGKRWDQLLAQCGIERRRSWRNKGRLCGVTRAQCRLLLETWYRQVGEFRMKRWR